MAAQAQWRVLVQRRAAEVELRCLRSCGVLADAVERLTLPVNVGVADAQDVRARLELVRGILTGASDDLALAACSMDAVVVFAERGAAAKPVAVGPLASVQANSDPVRLALSMLQSAKDFAEDACGWVGLSCGHLRTADSLLAAVPALPDLHGVLDGEHFTALRGAFEAALNLAKVSAVLAVTANWLLR
jgi:hypothetical protein